jgi:HEAT repeat protein
MPGLVPNKAPKTPQFDFISDLRASTIEDVYIAVKALGHLPEFSSRSVPKLLTIAASHPDGRVKLESAASLARLGKAEGWANFEAMSLDTSADPAYRMESALILAELPGQRSIDLLTSIANTASNESELRAAAAWGLSAIGGTLPALLPLTHDLDETTAVHAIIGSSRLVEVGNVAQVLHAIDADDRQAAGLVRAILSSTCDFVPELIRQLQSTPAGTRRQWLLYLAAAAGHARCRPFAGKLPAEIRGTLEFFWKHHAENWTNRLDVVDQIDFLQQQLAR